MAHKLTPQKARKILHDKEVRGHPLTEKQRRFFGWMSNKAYGGMLPIIKMAGGGVYSIGGPSYFTGGALMNFMRNNVSELNSPAQNIEPRPTAFDLGGILPLNPVGAPMLDVKTPGLASLDSHYQQLLGSATSTKPAQPQGGQRPFDVKGAATGAGLAGMAAGLLPEGRGASALQGAASGAAAGAALGPVGMGVGALIGGGVSMLAKGKEMDAQRLAEIQQKRSEVGSAFGNISPQAHIYELGGYKHELGALIRNRYAGENPSGRYLAKGGDILPRLTEFNEGGSHESNPNGGVQQGVGGPNGEPNLVEQGETKFKNYIYSDRLKLNNPREYNLGGNLTGKSFAYASKKLSKLSEDRPNDPIAKKSQDLLLGRLREANDDAIEMKKFEEQNEQFAHGGCLQPTQVLGKFKYGGFIFKDI